MLELKSPPNLQMFKNYSLSFHHYEDGLGGKPMMRTVRP